jgi:hypothetical protein
MDERLNLTVSDWPTGTLTVVTELKPGLNTLAA